VAPRVQRRVAWGAWGILLLLAVLWLGWGVWAVLVLAASRGRLTHAPVVDDYRPVPRGRRPIAIACALVFVTAFTPIPFAI